MKTRSDIRTDINGVNHLVDCYGQDIDPTSKQGRRIQSRWLHAQRANASTARNRAWYIAPPSKPSMRNTSGGLGSDASISQGKLGQSKPELVDTLAPIQPCMQAIHSHCIHTKALPIPPSSGWGIAY